MKLTLIRHTSVDVPNGLIYGQTDVKLNDSFQEELQVIKTKIPNNFDIVFSSPLTRCTTLACGLTNKFKADQRLMELNFGAWEGNFWNNIDKTPEAQTWFNDYINIACPEGESYQDMFARVKSFYNELIEFNAENICVITHGGPIRAFIAIIEGVPAVETFNRTINYGEVIQYKIESIQY